MVADYHALTTHYDKGSEIHDNRIEIVKDLLACGLDPERTAIFNQSSVRYHAELHLLFSMITPLGWIERVPTYKEKVSESQSPERESYGLLGYPVLQAADILLYRPYGVPVGKDQLPHVEVANDIGARFNNLFGEVFPHFKYLVPEEDTRSKVPGLDVDEGGNLRKMSKSYDNCIYLADSPDEIRKKVYGAYTTPSKLRATDPGVPEGCAVCQLLRLYSPDSETQLEEDRQGIRGCVKNKAELTEMLVEYLRPIREKRNQIDLTQAVYALSLGRDYAEEEAMQTMSLVKKVMKFRFP